MRFIVFLFIVNLTIAQSKVQAIKRDKLKELVSICEKGHSDGLLIYKDNKLIIETYFGEKPTKIDIKSVTKSITNLAVGFLVTQGKLDIDQKVYEFYPEWKQENKQDITVKHLLTHTSGLLDSDFELVENTPDILKFALTSDLSHPVGRFYVYNNKAVNLLAGIIEKVYGYKLDQLIMHEIFDPLGIKDITWPKDQSGNPYVMAFLQMYPKDLAKVGQFVLNKGQWKGKQIIAKSWFDLSTSEGADFMPEYGLLWELLTEDFRLVVDDEQIEKMRTLKVNDEVINKTVQMKGEYNSYGQYYGKLRQVFGKNYNEEFLKVLVPHGLTVGRKLANDVIGYAGIGYLGQYLVIYPKYNLVAVRGINHYPDYNWQTDEINDFPQKVLALIED